MSDQYDELLTSVGGPPREALNRLIYVVGSARGGTSITQAILAQHDSVIAMHGPSSFLNHVWRYRNKVHERLWRQLLWTPGYLRRAPVRDSLNGKRRDAFIKLINVAVSEKKLRDVYRLYPLVRALDPDENRDLGTMKAWLDKGNDFWGVKLLPKAFPEGRFVFVIRDPRGAVASLSKRFADLRPDSELKVEPVDVITTAIYWRNLVREQLRFARSHAGQTVLFRFEDLTQRPVEMAQSLYDALGLPAVPKSRIARKLDNLAYGTSLGDETAATGISTAPNERWKKKLDSESIALIASICGPSANALGYELPVKGPVSGFAAILRHVPGLRQKISLLAKLTYLTIADRHGRFPGMSSPMRLLEAK